MVSFESRRNQGDGSSLMKSATLTIWMPLYWPSCKQVAVASHDELRTGGHRAFEHTVIVGVIRNNVNRLSGAHQFGTACKLQHGLIDFVGGPSEFRLENPAEFLAYRFGNRKTDAAIFGRLEKLVGETRELKRGDVDIGVGGDPDHLNGLAAALAGIRLSGGEHQPR